MYRREKLKINLFYNDIGISILDVLNLDFKEFFEDYLKRKIL